MSYDRLAPKKLKNPLFLLMVSVTHHSVESGISMCRITMLSLESLLVRSNTISVGRIIVLCLESLFVR